MLCNCHIESKITWRDNVGETYVSVVFILVALALVVGGTFYTNLGIAKAQNQSNVPSVVANTDDNETCSLGNAEDFDKVIRDYNESTFQPDDKTENELKEIAKNEIKKDGLLKTKNVKLDFKNAKVKGVKTPSDLKESYIVTINFSGENILPLSSITLGFDENKKVFSNIEMVLKDVNKEEGEITVYKQGEKVLNETIDKQTGAISGKESKIEKQSVTAQSFWSCFEKCLSNKGIAAWAITALSIACGVICVGTVGAGCLACLAAAGAVADWAITDCFVRCK